MIARRCRRRWMTTAPIRNCRNSILTPVCHRPRARGVIPLRLGHGQSGDGLVLLRPQRGSASGDRERQVGGVEIPARREVEPGLGRICDQHAVESACPRPQFAARSRAPGPYPVQPRPRRQEEEHRERHHPHRDREEPPDGGQHSAHQGRQVGDPHPPLGAPAYEESVGQRPTPHGVAQGVLCHRQLLTRGRVAAGFELGSGPVHIEGRSHGPGDRVDAIPRRSGAEAPHAPRRLPCLAQFDQAPLAEMEQGGGQCVGADRLGANVFALNGPDSVRRGVLQRERRRLLHRVPVHQHRAYCGGDGQRSHQRDGLRRPAQDAIPFGGPGQFGPRRGGNVDAESNRHRSARRQVDRGHRDGGPVDRQVGAGRPDTGPHRARRPADTSRKRHLDVGAVDAVVPGRRDDIPEEHRPRRAVVGYPDCARECPVFAGGTRIENPGNRVADLEDVGARIQVTVRVADLGNPESPVLPEQLVPDRAAVHQHGGDLGVLTHPGVIRVADVPVAENPVPIAGKPTRDRLDRLQSAVSVDVIIRAVLTDRHRIVDRPASRPAGEHQRPQHAEGGQRQGEQPPDHPAQRRHLHLRCPLAAIHPMRNGSTWIRTGSWSRRALSMAVARRRRRGQCQPLAPFHPNEHPDHLGARLDAGRPAHARRQVHRAEDIGAARDRARQPRGRQQRADRLGGSVHGGQVNARRQADLGAGVQFGFGMPHRIPADQRLHRGNGRVGDNSHHASIGPGPHQCGGGHPAPEGVLGDPQILATQQRPTVQE